MAVDYFHRLLVVGPTENVKAFKPTMYREYPRTVGGETWTEIVPFCFQALYELAPAARRIEAEVPCDPYELSAWPPRRLDRKRAEVRYQFQTRNLEMGGLLRALSGALPSLTLTLVTLCLDDSSIETIRFRGGRSQKWAMGRRESERLWDRARKKFGLADDEVYDDDVAERWVEGEMLHAALIYWETPRKRTHRPGRRRDWWNQPRLRDLETERQVAMFEIAEAFALESRRKRRRARKGRRGRKRARGKK